MKPICEREMDRLVAGPQLQRLIDWTAEAQKDLSKYSDPSIRRNMSSKELLRFDEERLSAQTLLADAYLRIAQQWADKGNHEKAEEALEKAQALYVRITNHSRRPTR